MKEGRTLPAIGFWVMAVWNFQGVITGLRRQSVHVPRGCFPRCSKHTLQKLGFNIDSKLRINNEMLKRKYI